MFLIQIKTKLNIQKTFLLSVCILFLAGFAWALPAEQKSCSNLYLQKEISKSGMVKKSPRLRSENLIQYLSKILEQQHVRLESLQQMLRALEQGQLINPISEKEALNSIKKIIRDGIQSVISRDDLDRERLIQGLQEIVKEETRQVERREEAHNETEIPYFKPVFHEIRPEKFMMGELDNQVEVIITAPFAMMDTQVTQYEWARLKILMGEKT